MVGNNKKVFSLNEALKTIATDAARGREIEPERIKRIGQIQKWIDDFEQGKFFTDYDISI